MIRCLTLVLLTLAPQGCVGMVDPVPEPSIDELDGTWVGVSTRGSVWRVVLNRDVGTSTDGVAVVQGDSAYPDELERLAVRSWRLDKFDIWIVMDAPRTMAAQAIEWRGAASPIALDLHNGAEKLILQREEGFAARLERLRDGSPQSQMPEDDAKGRALAYAASKNMDVSRLEKVTAKWYARNVDTGAGPYWSVNLSWPFDGIPDANTATIWVEEDGSCKGTWER